MAQQVTYVLKPESPQGRPNPRYAVTHAPAEIHSPAILGSALRVYASLRRQGLYVEEWHVHPVGYQVLLRQVARRFTIALNPPTLAPPTLFGAPLFVDTDCPPRRLVAFLGQPQW